MKYQNPYRHPQQLAAAGVLLCWVVLLFGCKVQQAAENQPGEPVRSSAAMDDPEAPRQVPLSSACPSQDFNEFLKAYAGDDAVQKRFTAPVVKVARISEGEDGDQTVMESVPADEYDGFLFSYRNGKYGFAGAEVDARDPGLQLIVRPESNGAYFVTIPDNVEAISYRFERYGDCWRLTEDPEAYP